MIQFLFGALLPCVYILGWTGFSIETNWIFLWATLPIAMLFTKIRMTPAHWVGAIFLLWALLSLSWTPSWDYGVEATMFLGTTACAFLLGAEHDDRLIFRGLAVGIAINSVVAIYQSFGYATGIAGGTAAGLLYNGNALAEPAALVALALLLEGSLLWALPAAPAILLPHTRAGLAILAIGFLAWTWQRSREAAIMLAIVLTSIGTLALAHGYRIPSTEQRAAIWLDTTSGLTTFGHGLGSFGHSYPRYATRIDTSVARPFHAHSDFLEVTFELGIAGLALFLSFIGLCWLSAAPRERTLLAACLALVAFDFPLHVPTTAFIVAMLAGRAASGWHEHGLQWRGRRLNLDAWLIRRGLLQAHTGLRNVPL